MSRFAPNIGRREILATASAAAFVLPGAAAAQEAPVQPTEAPAAPVPTETAPAADPAAPIQVGTPNLLTPQDIAKCYDQWKVPGVVTSKLQAKIGRKTVEQTVTVTMPSVIRTAANAEIDCNQIAPVSVWRVKKQRVAKKNGSQAATSRVRSIGKSEKAVATSAAVTTQDPGKLVVKKKFTLPKKLTKKQAAKRTYGIEQQVIPVLNEQAIKAWNPNIDMSQVPAPPTISKTYWIGRSAVKKNTEGMVYSSEPPKQISREEERAVWGKCGVSAYLAPGTIGNKGGTVDRNSPYLHAAVAFVDGVVRVDFDLLKGASWCEGILYTADGTPKSFVPSARNKYGGYFLTKDTDISAFALFAQHEDVKPPNILRIHK